MKTLLEMLAAFGSAANPLLRLFMFANDSILQRARMVTMLSFRGSRSNMMKFPKFSIHSPHYVRSEFSRADHAETADFYNLKCGSLSTLDNLKHWQPNW